MFSRITSKLPPQPSFLSSQIGSRTQTNRRRRRRELFLVPPVRAPSSAADQSSLFRLNPAIRAPSLDTGASSIVCCDSAIGHPCSSAHRRRGHVYACSARRPTVATASWCAGGAGAHRFLIHHSKHHLTLAGLIACTQPNIHLNPFLHQISQARLTQDGGYDAACGSARNQTRPRCLHTLALMRYRQGTSCHVGHRMQCLKWVWGSNN